MKNTIFLVQEVENIAELTGVFYVIENFPHPRFVMDENGETKSFDTYHEALEEANECQEGYVISFE